MAAFDDPAFDDHERVVFCRDVDTGLKAIIAIHSTALGPAAGGCRIWNYESANAALHDVLRLSQGMSYKNAMAGLDFGGGKAVIIKAPEFKETEALFEKFGEFVEKLNGDYVTAEDVGMSVDIMEMIARKTSYVAGLTPEAGQAGGDPSPKTAFGIFKGIEAAVEFKLGKHDLNGLRVAVQGAGHVGYYLCRYLSEAGAELIVADIDETREQRVCDEFGAKSAPLDEILFEDADVLAPCALGAILNENSIPRLKVGIVAGGANNQLETHADGQRLSDAGILYAPDYVINGGGIINVSCEYSGGHTDEQVMELVAAIGPRLTRIFEVASESGNPTNVVADDHARKIIAAGRSRGS
jgi:leucine dehydrogenase